MVEELKSDLLNKVLNLNHLTKDCQIESNITHTIYLVKRKRTTSNCQIESNIIG